MPRNLTLLSIASVALAVSFIAGRASVLVPERRLVQERPVHREAIVTYWPVESVSDRGMLQIMYIAEQMQAETVRLRGIYLPQPGEPLHDAALASLAGMVADSAIALDFDGPDVERDGSGCLWAYVWANTGGADYCLNIELVRLGMARCVEGDGGGLDEKLQEAERKAREAGRGIWASDTVPTEGG